MFLSILSNVHTGSLFRNLPEFVHVISGVAGFCVYAVYQQEDSDFMEDTSHPATQLIVTLVRVRTSYNLS